MAEPKKISFGFSKLTKKPNLGLNPSTIQEKVELIDCLESQTIKIKDALEEIYTPLVIPMPTSNSTPLQRIINRVKQEDIDNRPDSELTPIELAARELIRDAQNSSAVDEHRSNLILPVGVGSDSSQLLEDKDEPTLFDYENVPITEYGLAMLRGMGWKEGTGIGKTSTIAKVKEPNLRPKGMGLGANIIIKNANEMNGEELVLKKGGYAKIVDGKQKGQYCEVQGFDDQAGRIIVRTSLQGLILALNEFLIVPVTKAEYMHSSKVINNAKYEEYKNREAQHSTSLTESSHREQKHNDSSRRERDSHKSIESKDKNKYRYSHSSHISKDGKNDRRKKQSDSSSDSEKDYNHRRNERSKYRH